jgi:hypothetical protein
MLVIVADLRDAGAIALADRWRSHDAQILSPADLSVAGWCHPVGAPGARTAVVSGQVVGAETITGVLTLLPYVSAQELIHIVPEDRSYVAAEMMAFLASWLSDLTCPVLNRPRPDCLTGPNWRRGQWVHAAAQLGVRVRPVLTRVGSAGETLASEPPAATVTVVAGRCFGQTDAALQVHASRLAASVEVAMMAVHFDGPTADARMISADLRPDVSSPVIADAILGHLGGSDGC